MWYNIEIKVGSASAAQGKLVSLGHPDPPLDFKNTEDSTKLGHKILNAELEKTVGDKMVKSWNSFFANKPTGKSTFPSVEDISDRKDKVKANKDDPLVENAHISEDDDNFESDEDSTNPPPKRKSRLSKKVEEDTEETVDPKQEQEKEEKDKKSKDIVIVDDESGSSSVQHSSRCRTRRNAKELELKTKGNQQVQERKDLKEAANAMMMLVKDAEDTIKIFT
ncbi:uncharacterized protein LOC131856778 [Cryptomeria japonica]|uniref:uncharacterized protein LOC131856778 n=1 Tax=Cryptomeria japonica TaxID=3369 RepID=UPI0027D9E35F|nr:uncharacterized protein LOC131856778 [Cryptomeria japonica]